MSFTKKQNECAHCTHDIEANNPSREPCGTAAGDQDPAYTLLQQTPEHQEGRPQEEKDRYAVVGQKQR